MTCKWLSVIGKGTGFNKKQEGPTEKLSCPGLLFVKNREIYE
jgi:hypothetical protein